MTTVLITGEKGFVGRHAVERARARGWEVRTATGDLREPDVARDAMTSGVDAVLHLAAPPRSGLEPWDMLDAELRMARNVLAAAQARPVVFIGSAAQYGLGAAEPMAEDAAVAPLTPYAAVKTVVERAVESPALGHGGRVVWARPFNIVGPGQPESAPVASWAAQLARGARALRTGDLTVVRDFLDVRDAADALLELTVAEGASGAVNVGSGVATALRDVATALCDATGGHVELELDPALRRATDPPHVVADVTRLRAFTGLRPEHTLESSLADVLAEARSRQPAEARS